MELTEQEEARQLRRLTEIRFRHHLQLTGDGVIERLWESTDAMNRFLDKSTVFEGTLFYVQRERINDAPMLRLVGPGSIAESNPLTSQVILDTFSDRFNLVTGHTDEVGDIMIVRRLDAHQQGYGITTICVGVAIRSGEDADIVIPFQGVSPEDAQAVAGMLHEMRTLQETGELSCLDPDSLVNVNIGRSAPTPMP